MSLWRLSIELVLHMKVLSDVSLRDRFVSLIDRSTSAPVNPRSKRKQDSRRASSRIRGRRRMGLRLSPGCKNGQAALDMRLIGRVLEFATDC